jgi:hypothetical protein
MVGVSNLQPTEHGRGDHPLAGARRSDSLPVRAALPLNSYTTSRDTNLPDAQEYNTEAVSAVRDIVNSKVRMG